MNLTGHSIGRHHMLERFEREAKALTRLTQPNIVHVNDFGKHEGVPYRGQWSHQ